jgi:iron-sulfur cluster assembly protein
LLILTEAAAVAVKSVTSTPQASEGSGLRIASSVPQPRDPSALQLSPEQSPEPGDQVIEAAGALVFVEPQAAAYLDDKVLDAQVDEEGTARFALGVQSSGQV